MSKRAFIYTRVSTEGQAQPGRNVSLAVQRETCERFCADHDLVIVGRFEDIASGRRTDRRSYLRMLDACRRGEADAVVVMFFDRFGRDMKESMRRWWELDDLGIDVLATEERIDVAADDGLSRTLSMWMAQRESKRIGERVRGALRRKFHDDPHWLNGWVPYGYRADYTIVAGQPQKQIVIDPMEADVIRRILRSYVDGMAANAIARMLNQDGILPRKGRGGWTAQAVLNQIDRPHNAGFVRRRTDAGPELHAGKIPPLADQTLLDAVATRRALTKQLPRRAISSRHLLSGILYCGTCNRRMTGMGNVPRKQNPATRTSRAYQCQHHHRGLCATGNYQNAPRLEAAVLTELAAYADDEAFVQRLLADHAPAERDHAAALRAAQADLAGVDRDLQRRFDAFERGDIDRQQFSVLSDGLRARRDALQARLADLAAAQRARERRRAAAAELPQQLRAFAASVRDLPILEQKAQVQRLLQRVTVWPDGRLVIVLATG